MIPKSKEPADDQASLWQQITTYSKATQIPLDDSLLDFVKKLTERDPLRRPSHDAIREHPLWGKLQQKLPPFSHNLAGDEEWVAQSCEPEEHS